MKLRKRSRSQLNEHMVRLFNLYRAESGVPAISLDELYDWAKEQGHYDRAPTTERTQFKREMARALREHHSTDPQGRRVRTNHAAKVEIEGEQKYLWANIFEAPPEHMQLSLQQRRRHLVAQAVQHQTDTESYNENNIHGAQLEFTYNLETDLEELRQPTDYPEDAPDTETEP